MNLNFAWKMYIGIEFFIKKPIFWRRNIYSSLFHFSETIPKAKCAALPSSFTGLPGFAKEYGLAFLALPPDVSNENQFHGKKKFCIE